jgi:hypothetical protein
MSFFSRKTKTDSTASKATPIDSDFDKLVAADTSADESAPNSVSAQGLVEICKLIGVDPDDIVICIIAWKLQSVHPWRITKTEWSQGMARMRIDTMEKLKQAVPALRAELNNANNFRDFYYYVFDWIKDSSSKVLSNDTACAMWPLFLGKRFKYLDVWIEYVSTVYKKSVSRDVWKQLIDFAQISSYDAYDPDAAWPTIMDEFVEWMKERQR